MEKEFDGTKWGLAAVLFALLVGGVIIFYLFQNPPRSQLERLSADLMDTAKGIVKDNLSDPASATFDEVRIVLDPGTNMARVCGLVNAKNKLGGYVGRTPFVVKDGIAYILNDLTAKVRAGPEIVKPCFPGL